MNSALALVNNGIKDHDDPIKLLEAIPNIVLAIELAQTPDEISGIRSMVRTFQTYLKETLPGVMADRNEIFTHVHKTGVLLIEASAKAGAIWQELDNKRKAGGDQRSKKHSADSRNEISWHDAGFKSDKDVTRCVRAAELDEADRWQYYEECRVNSKEPTMNGIEHVWREFYRERLHDEISSTDVELPTGQYRVIYADPPWAYQNNMPDYFTEQADHYPLLTVKQLCELKIGGRPIREIAGENAVLFLWVTSPILEESFEVINSWSFKYKASFVWDKVKHNMGHYNSVRHEFLLVAVRGSCQPDIRKLYDSVQTVERTGHSEKPEIFREIIDEIYPNGKRIELFSRNKIEGWEHYGYELS